MYKNASWTLGPFVKCDEVNPCLGPNPTSTFHCPIQHNSIRWEEKDVFNPAAIVKDRKVYLLYRAEDTVGKHAGTSRIGIAESSDGLSFRSSPHPVLYPDDDFMKQYEWEGGCEDPRIVEDDAGSYYITYSAYDGKLSRLCVATSKDLFHWEKQGLAFGKADNGIYRDMWSKSGSIVCRREGERLIATRINGQYWMYWGDTNIYVAVSDNLIDWTPLTFCRGRDSSAEQLIAVFRPRENRFDSVLVECGPPAIITGTGILLIYNSKNSSGNGDKNLPDGTYAAGQVLFDAKDPTAVLRRPEDYFIKPDKNYEMTGQVDNVCFLEGLVYFKDKWLLYYGTADSNIAVASCSHG